MWLTNVLTNYGSCSQRWIYRVDPNRVNEYGQVMATDVDAVEGKEKTNVKTKKAESKKNR